MTAGRTALSVMALVGLLTGTHAVAGHLLDGMSMPSEALQAEVKYSIYLPYDGDAGADRYPVVYLLHGYGGTHREWIEGGNVADLLDRLIASGDIAPLIAVMPDAAKSWYMDSARHGGPGDYDSAITRDLVHAIDAEYPTIADAAHRGVAGISMGGHGALRFAFGHPDRFGAVAALSPGIWLKDGLSWKSGPAHDTAESQAQWYQGAFGVPFDPETYASLSPFAQIDAMASAADPPAIYLAVGDDDYWDLQDGTVELYVALRQHGLEPELRVGNGGHDWDYWRRVAPDMFVFFRNQFAD